MAELKTRKTNASVSAFLKTVPDEQKRKDSLALLKIFKEVTGEKPALWGTAIVGFGTYHYKSERSAQEGDWMLTGFSPRKQNLTIYIMTGLRQNQALLKKIGKHKISGGSCLYIKRLADIDVAVLKKLIKDSVQRMKERYGKKSST
jgi:hypothetical protein